MIIISWFEEDNVVEVSEWPWRAIHEPHAFVALAVLNQMIDVSWITFPIAQDNLKSFVHGVAPSKATGVQPASVANSDLDLEFAVGLDFSQNPDCIASVNEYFYASTSDVALHVAASNTMLSWVETIFANRNAEVVNDLATNPQTDIFSYEWPLVVNNFNYQHMGDHDLHLAFGKARLNASIAVEVERTGVDSGIVIVAAITGSQGDLYDWDYDFGFPDDQCAILQAVHRVHWVPTGGVYRNKVLFQGNPVLAVENSYVFSP